MGKTYREIQRIVKEYREQHPEFWCKVNVSYEELTKLYEKILQLQKTSVATSQPTLTKELKIIQIKVPVVQARTVPIYGTNRLPGDVA